MGISPSIEAPAERPRDLFRAGARDIAPFAVGYAPMAIGIGVAIGESGVDRLAGWAGGPLISAGTAQLTLLELVMAGGSVLVAIGAALLVNSRLVAYSAGLAQWFGTAPLRVRSMVAFFTIDVTYLLASRRFAESDPGSDARRWYLLGLGVPLYSAWAAVMAVGVVVGSAVPASLQLDRAATFMMIGLIVSALTDRRQFVAATAGAGAGLSVLLLPVSVVPLIAALAATTVAARAQHRDDDR